MAKVKRVPRPTLVGSDCGALDVKRVPRTGLNVPSCGALDVKCVPRTGLNVPSCGALDVKCEDCKHYDGKNCHAKNNTGVAIKYREEKQIFIKSPEVINKDKNCKEYVELSKK